MENHFFTSPMCRAVFGMARSEIHCVVLHIIFTLKLFFSTRSLVQFSRSFWWVCIAACLLVCRVHFKILLVLPPVSCLQDLVFLAGIFVLTCCESGFSCQDSCCHFSLFVARSRGSVRLFSLFPLGVIHPAPGAASVRRRIQFSVPRSCSCFSPLVFGLHAQVAWSDFLRRFL
jgi:hypothetical protein